jgi:2-polyprenyl-3-methyl-5-hydroxy-6-metoxy-1,4-benzoquinol methylase
MSRRSDDILLEHYRRLGNQANDFRNRNLRSLVASMVTGTSVLDIGCGSGHLLRLLQDQGKDVVGLEPSGELVDLAQALHGPSGSSTVHRKTSTGGRTGSTRSP